MVLTRRQPSATVVSMQATKDAHGETKSERVTLRLSKREVLMLRELAFGGQRTISRTVVVLAERETSRIQAGGPRV